MKTLREYALALAQAARKNQPLHTLSYDEALAAERANTQAEIACELLALVAANNPEGAKRG